MGYSRHDAWEKARRDGRWSVSDMEHYMGLQPKKPKTTTRTKLSKKELMRYRYANVALANGLRRS